MKKSRVAVSLLGMVLFSSSAIASSLVETASGAVSGQIRSGVQVFLGIPYAKPPIGDLRWRAPQPPDRWEGVRAATEFAPSCPQGDPIPFGPYTAAFLITPERSEDCLYLNVWTPAADANKRPVYFFIHGGAFQAGGASVPIYDGAVLATKGVVVITINYRLGMLGFLAHPKLSRESPLGTSGNYGLLDIIEALRWVRDNIARFGGDPTNVTIAGQSAGASAVAHLLLSPLAQGLFHRAVIESGPVIGIPLAKLEDAEKAGVEVASRLKADSIEALRRVDVADLARAASLGSALPNLDGKVVVEDPDRLDARITNKVPIIAGYNRDEIATPLPQTAAAFQEEVRRRFGSLADRALALYPHGSDAEAARSGAELARDRYVAALLLWAEQREAQGLPVHGYLFEHTFPGPNSERWGAFHTAEVPYIFGALHLPGVKITATDEQISNEMQDRWIAFMRTGDPNPPGVAKTWSRAIADPTSIWRIGTADNLPVISAQRLALFRDLVARGGKLGFL